MRRDPRLLSDLRLPVAQCAEVATGDIGLRPWQLSHPPDPETVPWFARKKSVGMTREERMALAYTVVVPPCDSVRNSTPVEPDVLDALSCMSPPQEHLGVWHRADHRDTGRNSSPRHGSHRSRAWARADSSDQLGRVRPRSRGGAHVLDVAQRARGRLILSVMTAKAWCHPRCHRRYDARGQGVAVEALRLRFQRLLRAPSECHARRSP